MADLYGILTTSGASGFPVCGESWYPTKKAAAAKMKDWESSRDDVVKMELVKGTFPKYTKAELELVAANGRYDPDEIKVVKTWTRET